MRNGLHIAFFGSSLVSSYWNGAATYYRGIIRALSELGHHVTFYEPDALDRQAHRDMPDPSWASVRVYAARTPGDVQEVLDEAQRADVVVKASGVGVFDELLEQAVAAMRSPVRQVIYWDVDAPATLDRLHAQPGDPLRGLIGQYDMVLTYGGGEPVRQAYLALGARLCEPIYNALDPQTHYPVEPQQRLVCDLAFLGNRLPDREARVDTFFFDAARLLAQGQLLLGGSGWADKPMPRNVRYVGHVSSREHNLLNCSARMVLNINRASMARYGFSPPTRVFEAAGAGACLITDAWEGIELFLEPGREVLVAGDGQDVARHVAGTTVSEARQIGQAARRRVLHEHTYRHRAEQLQQLLGCHRTQVSGAPANRPPDRSGERSCQNP